MSDKDCICPPPRRRLVHQDCPVHGRGAVLPSLKAFVSGSYAYGRPRPSSDIDLVVFVTEADLARIRRAAGRRRHGPSKGLMKPRRSAADYQSLTGVPFRFGDLNLICVTDERAYKIWRTGTVRLKKRRPVTRETAVREFQRIKRQYGE
jgi:predicted nucleotidyltransferase